MSSSTYHKVMYTFKCETVTPLLNYGANNKKGQSYPRTSSIKGMIRYWWRAIKPIISDQVINNHNDLLKEEIKLFGGISQINENEAIKSPLKLSIKNVTQKRKISLPVNTDDLIKNVLKENRYFYGSFDVILKGKSFPLSFGPKNNSKTTLTLEQWEEIKFSTHVALLLGGLGKRSRRGFGSFAIKIDSAPHNDVLSYLRFLFDKYKNNFPKMSYTYGKDRYGFDVICFNKIGETNHSFLKAIWIGSPIEITRNNQNNVMISLLREINHAKRKINSSSFSGIIPEIIIQEVLGCINSKKENCLCIKKFSNKKYASQLWVKILKINNKLFPVYTYLCPSKSTVCDKTRICQEPKNSSDFQPCVDYSINKKRKNNFCLQKCLDSINDKHLEVIRRFIKKSQL